MALQEIVIFKVEIAPDRIAMILPSIFNVEQNVPKPKDGFKNKLLRMPVEKTTVALQISYDGESELLAIVEEAPKGISEGSILMAFNKYLGVKASMVMGVDDEDEDEDSEDDEDFDDEDEDPEDQDED